MGFIEEAEVMLQNAEKAKGNKALRIGWLTLAKDTVSAAITEAKKGVKAQDGHVAGQTSLDDYAGAPVGSPAKVNGSGVVLTPADEVAPPEEPDGGDGDGGEGDGDGDGDADPEDRAPFSADLPSEESYDALEAHKRHVAEDPASVVEGCLYCDVVTAARADHGRPDGTEDIPRINDSRGLPDGEGAQLAPAAP